MTDQVRKLSSVGIPVTFLGSVQKDTKDLLIEVENGKYRLVFSTPESFYQNQSTPREIFTRMATDNKN